MNLLAVSMFFCELNIYKRRINNLQSKRFPF